MTHILTLSYFFFVLICLFLSTWLRYGSLLSLGFYCVCYYLKSPFWMVRVCGRCRGCITQVLRCLTGQLPTLTSSLYLHRLAVSKETVREVTKKTNNIPTENKQKKFQYRKKKNFFCARRLARGNVWPPRWVLNCLLFYPSRGGVWLMFDVTVFLPLMLFMYIWHYLNCVAGICRKP